jgi:predicted transglutaminase-like protease
MGNLKNHPVYAPASNHLQCKLNLMPLRKNFLITVPCAIWIVNIQGVSEIHVLILTSGRTRQFMKLFSITFCKIRKSIARVFAPQFLPNESFCMIN